MGTWRLRIHRKCVSGHLHLGVPLCFWFEPGNSVLLYSLLGRWIVRFCEVGDEKAGDLLRKNEKFCLMATYLLNQADAFRLLLFDSLLASSPLLQRTCTSAYKVCSPAPKNCPIDPSGNRYILASFVSTQTILRTFLSQSCIESSSNRTALTLPVFDFWRSRLLSLSRKLASWTFSTTLKPIVSKYAVSKRRKSMVRTRTYACRALPFGSASGTIVYVERTSRQLWHSLHQSLIITLDCSI